MINGPHGESRLTNLQKLALLLLFVILPVFLFFRFHPEKGFDSVFGPGDSFKQYFPSHHWIKHFPLWNDLIKSGNPDAADPQSQAFYPLALLFSGVFPQPLAFNAFVVFHYALAGMLMFLFLRSLQTGIYASTIGSLVFVYSGFLMSHKGHVTMVNAAIWLPLILLGIIRFSRTFEWTQLFLSAAGLALSILAGHPQITLYQTMVAAGYVFYLALSEKKTRILFALFVPVIALFFAAVQVLPTIEAFQQCTRETIDYPFFSSYSFELFDLPLLFFPTLYGTFNWPANFTFRWGATELTGYIGILPLIFAISAFPLLRREKGEVKFWTAVGIAGFLLALGSSTPFYRLMFYVPVYGLFRAPARNWYEVHFAIAVLCAFALDAFFARGLSKNPRALRTLQKCALFIFLLAAFFWIMVRLLSTNHEFVTKILEISRPSVFLQNLSFFSISIWIPFLIISISCLVTYFLPVIQTYKKLQFCLALFILLDLWSFGFFFGITFIPSALWKQESALVKFLKMREENFDSFRIFCIPSLNRQLYNGIQPNLNLIHGIPLLNGYGPIVLRSYSTLTRLNAAGKAPAVILNNLIANNHALSLLSAKYIVVSDPGPAMALMKRRDLYHVLFKDNDGTMVFSNEQFLPRARFVRAVLPVDGSEDAIARRIREPDFKLKSTALLEASEKTARHLRDGVVQRAHYSPRQIQFRVETQGKGFLILSDAFYPGWVAEIDGKPTTIYKTNVCVRGIFIPNKGIHSISFQYKPRSIYYGIVITSVSVFLALSFSVFLILRKRLKA